MLNWDLLDENEQEKVQLKERIRYLERTIEAFKKYDTQRKEYIHKLEEKIELLEIDDSKAGIRKIKRKYDSVKGELNALHKKYELSKHFEDVEELIKSDKGFVIQLNIQLVKDNKSLKEMNAKLKSQNTCLRDANKELINKLFANEDALVLLDIIEKKLLNALE